MDKHYRRTFVKSGFFVNRIEVKLFAKFVKNIFTKFGPINLEVRKSARNHCNEEHGATGTMTRFMRAMKGVYFKQTRFVTSSDTFTDSKTHYLVKELKRETQSLFLTSPSMFDKRSANYISTTSKVNEKRKNLTRFRFTSTKCVYKKKKTQIRTRKITFNIFFQLKMEHLSFVLLGTNNRRRLSVEKNYIRCFVIESSINERYRW